MAYDVAIIGGGIIGSAAATYLAEAGQTVVLFEAGELAAGASGRNSGVLQHPYDAPLAALYHESVGLYGELAAIEPRFELGLAPAGLLIVGYDAAALAATAVELAADLPELAPRFLPPDEARAEEPALAEGVAAILLATGYPVVPQAATLAFGRRATRVGADLRTGVGGRPWIEDEAVRGVQLDSGERVGAGQLLVAAGPWTPELLDGWRAHPPIGRTWGVVVSTRVKRAPRHSLEQHGINPASSAEQSRFTLITAGGVSSVGSTFLPDEPDPDGWTSRLLEAGAGFVPALAEARVTGVRSCARPVAFDGRPLIGALPPRGLFVCAGHGPWGMSTGPASARLIVELMLGGEAAAPLAAELVAERWEWRPAP